MSYRRSSPRSPSATKSELRPAPGRFDLAAGRRQTPRWIQTVHAGVIDEDPVPVWITQDRLTPQVGLVGRRLLESDPLPLELAHHLAHPVGLEVQADHPRRTLDRAGGRVTVQ